MAKASEKKTTDQLVTDNIILKMVIKMSDWKPVYDQVVKSASKRIKIDGFRKGKVPAHIAVQHLKPEYLYQEVLDRIVAQHYQTLIESEKKSPITYPEFKPLNMPHDGDWEIEVQIAEYPSFSVKDFKKIVKKAKESAKKEWENQEKKKEESTDNKKKQSTSPKEDQNKAFQDFELRYIYSQLVQEIKPGIPELLVKRETEHDLHSLRHSLERVNMTLEQFLQRRNISVEEYMQETAAEALTKLQLTFVLQEIVRSEKIEVTENEIRDYIDKIPDKKAKEYYSQSDQRGSIERIMIQEKLEALFRAI